MGGVDVARTAGDQQSVKAIEQGQLPLAHGRDHDRHRAGAADQGLGVAGRGRVHDALDGGSHTGGDADNGGHGQLRGQRSFTTRGNGRITFRRATVKLYTELDHIRGPVNEAVNPGSRGKLRENIASRLLPHWAIRPRAASRTATLTASVAARQTIRGTGMRTGRMQRRRDSNDVKCR